MWNNITWTSSKPYKTKHTIVSRVLKFYVHVCTHTDIHPHTHGMYTAQTWNTGPTWLTRLVTAKTADAIHRVHKTTANFRNVRQQQLWIIRLGTALQSQQQMLDRDKFCLNPLTMPTQGQKAEDMNQRTHLDSDMTGNCSYTHFSQCTQASIYESAILVSDSGAPSPCH